MFDALIRTSIPTLYEQSQFLENKKRKEVLDDGTLTCFHLQQKHFWLLSITMLGTLKAVRNETFMNANGHPLKHNNHEREQTSSPKKKTSEHWA